jgi:TonB-linked SusC/RagA family outer membrane protein
MYKIFTHPAGGCNARVFYKFFRIMKLTWLLIIIAILQVSAKTLAQTVSINVKNTELEKVLVQIQQQSGYNFLYDDQLLAVAKPVSLSISRVTITEALDKCLANQPINYVINNKTITLKPKLLAPKGLLPPLIKINGKIIDSKGLTLPGVSIRVKGTAVAAAADADGNYTINADANAVLTFTSIGFITQEVAVKGRATINITLLEDTKGLEEVVVVGFGQQRKVNLTGAVSSVKGSELRENPTASLQNTLSGKLPGFFSQQRTGQPGTDGAAFFIRGTSSFATTATPIILVDDIEFSYDQFARLDPNEIESVSILKDAATTAIYGIKGANGVVLVTTRRGQVGPPKITLRTEAGAQEPTRVTKYLDSYNTALLRNQAIANDVANNILPATTQPEFTAADLEHFRTGDDPYGHPNVDWYHTLFKDNSIQWRNNIDISGGTQKTKYFVSLGSVWQNGMLRNFGDQSELNNSFYYNRYNYRSNLDIDVNKTLSVRFDLYGNVGETNNPNVPGPFSRNDVFFEVSGYAHLPPYGYPVYNPDGSYGFSNGRIRDNINNVVGRLSLDGYQRDYENNMNMVFNVTQKLDAITKGLSIKANVSYASSQISHRDETRDQFPSFIYNPTTNVYTPRDVSIFRIQKYRLTYDSGDMTRALTTQLILNYDRTFGDHHFYALGLANQQTKTYPSTNRDYDYIPENYRGFTGRVGYDYKHKYLLEFNAGYNGSDRFQSDHQYGFFPAVSAGWNIAEEKFIKNNFLFLDQLKIRGSYGTVGNDQIGSTNQYIYQQIYTRNGTTSFGTTHTAYSGIIEGQLGNDDVTWEKERKADIGLDFTLWGGKLGGTIDYFDNYRYDILTPRNGVSSIFGQTLPVMNVGQVSNKGYEVELTHNNRINKNLSYYIKANVSYARNKILYQDEAEPAYPWLKATGHSIGSIAVYSFDGFYKDAADVANSAKPPGVDVHPGDIKYKDLNGDGIIDPYDKSYIGYPNLPNTNYGLTLGVTWKGISVSAMLQGAANFNVRARSEGIDAFLSNLQPIHQQSWTPALGNSALYPRLSTAITGLNSSNDYPSDFWLVSGNYLRLKTAEIAYSLPKQWMQKLHLQTVKIYVNGYNLITWSAIGDRYQLDPEVSSGGDHAPYPPQKIYNVGLMIGL